MGSPKYRKMIKMLRANAAAKPNPEKIDTLAKKYGLIEGSEEAIATKEEKAPAPKAPPAPPAPAALAPAPAAPPAAAAPAAAPVTPAPAAVTPAKKATPKPAKKVAAPAKPAKKAATKKAIKPRPRRKSIFGGEPEEK